MNIRAFAAAAPCAIAIAASLALAGQASATVHNLTYKGTVTSALDLTAEFGAGPLIGKAFTAHVIYDDAKAGTTNVGGVYYDTYHGDGAANPVTATILLNGFTRTFGVTSGQDYREDRTLQPGCMFSCTSASFQQNAADRYVENLLYTLNYINLGGSSTDGAISGLAHTAPNYTNPPIDLYAFMSFRQQDQITLDYRHYADVGVKIDSVSGGVPEPTAWALMLTGFGGMGALLRRRRATALAPT